LSAAISTSLETCSVMPRTTAIRSAPISANPSPSPKPKLPISTPLSPLFFSQTPTMKSSSCRRNRARLPRSSRALQPSFYTPPTPHSPRHHHHSARRRPLNIVVASASPQEHRIVGIVHARADLVRNLAAGEPSLPLVSTVRSVSSGYD
jgi:hypothetical protein